SDSLLASARVRPASSAASVARRPAAPVTPLSTTSQGQAASSQTPSSPGNREYSAREPDVVPAERNESEERTEGTAAASATATAAGANSATCSASRPGLPPPAASPT